MTEEGEKAAPTAEAEDLEEDERFPEQPADSSEPSAEDKVYVLPETSMWSGYHVSK